MAQTAAITTPRLHNVDSTREPDDCSDRVSGLEHKHRSELVTVAKPEQTRAGPHHTAIDAATSPLSELGTSPPLPSSPPFALEKLAADESSPILRASSRNSSTDDLDELVAREVQPTNGTAKWRPAGIAPTEATETCLGRDRGYTPRHSDQIPASSSESKRERSTSPEVEERAKRRRAQGPQPLKLDPDDFHPPYLPLSAEQRRDWKGWMDLVSEPYVFEVMLRELGVQGVKVEEIYDLESAILTTAPPVYGLIFCFQYQESDYNQEGQPNSDVWFSNQLPATYYCATNALLNILFNTSDVKLGRALTYFKKDTLDLTSRERAHALNEHDFIRGVHNSLVSRMDIWNADRVFITKYQTQVKAHEKKLREEERAAEKASLDAKKAAKSAALNGTNQKASRHKGRARSKRKDEWGDEIEESPPDSPTEAKMYDNTSGYHYVAYVPIEGRIWRLDGLNAHPQDLGPYSHPDSWLCDAAPFIQERLQIFSALGVADFNLMALTKCAGAKARESLAENVKSLRNLEELLDTVKPDWRAEQCRGEEQGLRRASESLGLTDTMIAEASTLEFEDIDARALVQARRALIREQKQYQDTIVAQNLKEEKEARKLKVAGLDLDPTIHKILLDLEENGVVHELLDRHRDWDKKR